MSEAFVQLLLGGNRSSKTHTMAYKFYLLNAGKHPTLSAPGAKFDRPIKSRIIAPKLIDNIQAVILAKLKECVPLEDLYGNSWKTAYNATTRTILWKSGSVTRLFSLDQDDDVFGGADVDVAWFDEHTDYKTFLECLVRLVDRNGILLYSMTPEKGVTWEEEYIVDPWEQGDPDYAVWFFDSDKNPHLSAEGLEKVKKAIKDPRLADAKLHGMLVPLTGRVYDGFRRGTHVIKVEDLIDECLPENWYRQFVLDPHKRKPHYMAILCYSPDGDQYIEKMGKFATPLGVTQLKQKIRVFCTGKKIGLWLLDDANGSDGRRDKYDNMGMKSFKDQLIDGPDGFPFLGTNQEGGKDWEAGWHRMVDSMVCDPVSQEPHFYIIDDHTIDARECIRQFENYHWKDDLTGHEETYRELVANVKDDFPTIARYGRTSYSVHEPADDVEVKSAINEARSRRNG